MNFLLHDIVRAGDVTFTVLRVTPGAVVLIDVSSEQNWPEVFALAEADVLVESGAWTVEDGEAPIVALDRQLSEAQLKKRDHDWKIIEDIVADDKIFQPATRKALTKKAASAHAVTDKTVRKLLRLFFHRGASKAALTAAWDRCGAPGLTRAPGALKRGHPVSVDHPPGVNVTEEDRILFALAMAATFRKDKRYDLPGAYRYYLARNALLAGSDRRYPKFIERFVETGPPTPRQFEYWVKKENDWELVLERRMTPRVYQKSRRPLLKTSTAEVLGPCSKFQIDATILRVYVRSRANRFHLVGRPTLYIVLDVFSRMIVGFSLSFEPASWVAAMTALANCVEDKVAFCASFDFPIERDEWPVDQMCGVLLGDNGELKGNGIANTLKVFNVDVQNAAAYRADWKGAVERRFGLIETAMAPFTPGFVEPDFLERGARDYRGEAVFDLKDVMQNLIEIILYHNNFHELKGYPAHPGQIEDGVPNVPIELWRWGIANRTGSPRAPDPEQFRFALLPTATASATRQGLLFQGRFYECPPEMQRRLSQKALNGRFQVPHSYDKRDSDRIYVHDKTAKLGFVVARLTQQSSQHRGFNMWESNGLARAAQVTSAKRRPKQDLARAAMEARLGERARNAQQEVDAIRDDRSVAAQTKDLRANRAEERARDNVAAIEAFRPKPTPEIAGQLKPEGNVVAFRKPETPAGTFSMRNLKRQTQDCDDDD